MAPHALEPEDTHDTFHTNGITPSEPLKVFIIGAGIAGLAAAAGLRREGHEVEIFEQSSFANEVGAAIHLCPNASRIVLYWGLDPEKGQFNVTKSLFTAQANSLDPIYAAEYNNITEKYSSPWYLAHRVDLHSGLKNLVVRDNGKGKPGIIHLRSKVQKIDYETATLTFTDSTSRKASLIIAADGVHSSAVASVLGQENIASPTGSSAFRFLIQTEDLLADDRTKHILEGKDGQMKIFVGKGGRRLVWYPCRAGTLQNFVVIHPDNERYGSKEEWNVSSKTSDVLHEVKDFHPDLVAAVSKATDVKLWKLLYRPPIPTWHRQKLLLIGDAAHPMLPHQGQGGAQAIEDGAAIGVLLRGLKQDTPNLNAQIAARLDAFEIIRRKRASLMQIFSNAGQDEAEKIRLEAEKIAGDGVKIPSNPGEFQEFNFGHDVVAESERVLKTL